MSGDLFIETLNYDDIENIERCGGELLKYIYHADKDAEQYFVILYQRLKQEQQNRDSLPPHCYIVFEQSKTDKMRILQLSRILNQTSRPLGVVKNKQSLALWDHHSDIQKALCLWNAIQNGSITLEFYQVGYKFVNMGVKKHFKDFTMVNE